MSHKKAQTEPSAVAPGKSRAHSFSKSTRRYRARFCLCLFVANLNDGR
jgi:hypothetical protein